MSDRPSSHFEDVYDILSDYMAQGVTGCLSIEDYRGRTFRVYLMQGDILAAHAPGDGLTVVRRLVNAGLLGRERGGTIGRAIRGGGRFDELLQGEVAEDALADTLTGRFKQNLLDFCLADGGTIFEPMEAVFVDNIQVSHNSAELVRDTIAQAHRIAPLLQQAEVLTLAPGPVMPHGGAEARLAALCRDGLKLDKLLAASPLEPGQTLDLVMVMLDGGALVTEEGYHAAFEEPVEEAPTISPAPAPEPAAPEPVAERSPEQEGPDSEEEPTPVPDAPMPEAPEAIQSATEDEVDAALRRAEEIEARRAAAREADDFDDDDVVTRPAGHDVFGGSSDLVDDAELAMFDDYDHTRGMGQGDFSAERELLDVVDLRDVLPPGNPGADADAGSETPEIIEMGSVEDAPPEVAAQAVALNFAGPRLDESDARNKITVTNDVLAEVARALDECRGHGAGRVAIQLLLDGAPNQFSVLFQGIEASSDGRVDPDAILRNLMRRPSGEHRRLVNRALVDLIERGLSSSLEELEEAQIDEMLERIAGYQQRLGL